MNRIDTYHSEFDYDSRNPREYGRILAAVGTAMLVALVVSRMLL